jgi:D-alanyl-D-alanine carboxypeptidase
MRWSSVAFLACLGFACTAPPPPAPTAAGVLEAELQGLVDGAVAADAGVHGAALAVDAPGLAVSWEGAAGLADPAGGAAMTPATPVRIASNTKTYVAAAVLRLAEEGRLAIDDPIAAHLPDELAALLRGDGYDPGAITVRHLLTHSSGIFDHTSVPQFEQAILADPLHRWTRAEQVRAAVEWGDPHGAPGEIYTYCDTGYVLLGAIIEQASGRTLAAAVRELLGFERLGLRATWWETLEPPPEQLPARAHQFLGELDSFDFDPSLDLYGGGGIATTVGDLARFWRALFGGRVFAESSSLGTMLTTVDGLRPLPDAGERALPPGAYRMGVWAVDVAGHATWRHSGFWGTAATYVPELDLVVAATVNQHEARASLERLLERSIALVAARTAGPAAS